MLCFVYFLMSQVLTKKKKILRKATLMFTNYPKEEVNCFYLRFFCLHTKLKHKQSTYTTKTNRKPQQTSHIHHKKKQCLIFVMFFSYIASSIFETSPNHYFFLSSNISSTSCNFFSLFLFAVLFTTQGYLTDFGF